MSVREGKCLDVLIIGAGFAGLCAAIKLQEAGRTDFKILEKSAAVGGTWYENTYPGAACDVPSHFYCYSFEPNPNWSRKFAPQREILSYIHHCVDKYDLSRSIEFGQTVRTLKLHEGQGVWEITLSDGSSYWARHVINGMGGLHKPNTPKIDGQDSFKGPTMHSAQWDHEVDFSNKKVAVIGSAASAIQIVPELQKICAQIDIYQRTPNYIAPRYDRDFRASEKRRFARWPLWGRFYRWYLYKRLEWFVYPLTKQTSRLSKRVTRTLLQWVSETVDDPELYAQLVPDYTIGCKRILLSDDYYRTLTEANVALITQPIATITPRGIKTEDGKLHEADILIYATGFDISGHMASIEIIGRDGVSLSSLGPAGEEAFKGAVHSQFPNYYMVTGPNTGVGTTSVIFMIEKQIGYILQLIDLAGSDMLSVKADSQKRYNEDIQHALAKSVWASGCRSWYLREDGKNITLYPGDTRQFSREHRRVELKNYDVITPKLKH